VRRSAPEIYGGAFKNDSSLIGRHADAMSSAHGLGYFYQLLAMAGWSSLPWLWTLRRPTLVLVGRDDPLVPVINGRVLAHLMPHARLDDGHLFMVTRPKETAERIEKFLSEPA
jgi:pimeloyl-ACP methyl ester carboxylesterase